MSKLTLNVENIAVLTDDDLLTVAGGGEGGTMTCTPPCKTGCESYNCNGGTGRGPDSGCEPTSRGCKCPKPTNTQNI
jgi:hypothetical protein